MDNSTTVVCDIDAGDTAWILISTILVLGMMPALAFFEAGLLRRKNALSIMVQVMSGLGILSVLWQLIGYTLVYGPDHAGIIGDFSYGFLVNMQTNNCTSFAPTIPQPAFVAFQMMFACISPLLITGAFAERLRFLPFVIFIVLWEILVYYPLAHWIWGDGWLAKLGVVDFAGGIVIHTSAGTSSLIVALILGRRKDFNKYHGEAPPHNLTMAMLGASLLWLGWFGFNAGSAIEDRFLSSNTVLVTQMASSTSMIVWLTLHGIRQKKPSLVAIMNGAIAGMAGITPASGYVSVQSSFVIGIVLGFSSYLSIYLFKHKLRIDDALDVTSVHGVTGIIGSFAIGIAASKGINEFGVNGWIYGNPAQMYIQLIGIGIAAVWAGFWTTVIMLPMKCFFRIVPTEEDELRGLDVFEVEEGDAYNLEDRLPIHLHPHHPHQHHGKQDIIVTTKHTPDADTAARDEPVDERARLIKVNDNSTAAQQGKQSVQAYDDDDDDEEDEEIHLASNRDYHHYYNNNHTNNTNNNTASTTSKRK